MHNLGLSNAITRPGSRLGKPMAKPVGMWYYPGHWLNVNHPQGPPYSTYGPYWWLDQYGGAFANREALIGRYDERDQSTLDQIKRQCIAGGVDFLWFNYYANAGVPDGDHAIKNFMTSSVTGIKFAVGFESQTANAPVTKLADWTALCGIWGAMANHVDYDKIDGRPVLVIIKGEHFSDVVAPATGKTPAQLIAQLRADTGKNWYVVFCATNSDHWTYQAKLFGADAFSDYNIGSRMVDPVNSVLGPAPTSYDELDANYQFEWDRMIARLTSVGLEYVVPMTAGFDDTPWKGLGNGTVYGIATPSQLQRHFQGGRKRIESNPIVRGGVIYAFNEDAEGARMQPEIGIRDQRMRINCSVFKGRDIFPVPAAAPAPAPAPAVATTFDALYAGTFALNSNTTFFTRPSQARPTTKSANLSSPAYTDQNFGVKVFQVTDTSDTADTVAFLRNDYAKRQMFNCDGAKFLAVAENSFWHLYDATTFAHIDVPGRINGRMPGLTGTDCEPTWHPTNPNRIWYTADFGGLTWYELDITTGVSTTLFSFVGRLPAGFAAATSFGFGGEGRPSNDGRYWTFMAKDAGGGGVGLMTYDRQTDTILSSVATANKPNWVGTSPDGEYAVIGWHNFIGGLTNATAQARSTDTADGTRAYPIAGLSGTTWTTLDTQGEHGDVAMDALGNAVWVSVSYTSNMDVGDGAVYYRRMDNGVAYAYTSPNLNAYLGSDAAMHISGTAFNRPGWAIVSYQAGGGATTTWRDGCILALELKPTSPRVLRLAHHQSNSVYGATPLATPNRDLTRVLFGSDFRGGAAPFEQYMIGLPSWAFT